MKTLAVTGGIGSGKSAVCRLFAERGVPVYDSDSRTKGLYDDGTVKADALEAALGCPVRDSDGRLDRRRLASVIFSDAEKLEVLESVVHPLVLEDFISWRRECESRVSEWNPSAGDVPFVIIESAIILQKPLFRNVADKVLLVDAPVQVRLERASRRDGVPQAAVMARMEAQPLLNAISGGMAEPGADFVLVNDAGLEELSRKVDALCGVLWR